MTALAGVEAMVLLQELLTRLAAGAIPSGGTEAMVATPPPVSFVSNTPTSVNLLSQLSTGSGDANTHLGNFLSIDPGVGFSLFGHLGIGLEDCIRSTSSAPAPVDLDDNKGPPHSLGLPLTKKCVRKQPLKSKQDLK
ncbi:hypothetical protein C8R45DRAFT_1107019 [Mycena sanguinolenta]|nr:hypothetical protein C8R45DRAFT_1107019 [Mycena sanguinolenta]